ncbi:hypothetical protein [Planotetraspora mira]|uniref:Uncharacterized protein n=1 Tax=Planotetraspora mira TaxID=58121 RepID=A0A8J3XDT2_9ACTN|nr:hypothetical protein [Planotetraspora mira]GII32793.1 hypothetical protein Pmi06nite_62350 [Planotetraspora mira]
MSGYAWPFLVARGRRLGYRTILAPGFLISAGEHGVLDDTVVPDSQEDRAAVVETETPSGRRISIVHATHIVTAADVAEPGTPPAERAPRDTHSRPLQLIYGFVYVGGGAGPPGSDDLRICRDLSLAAYRRFLADEEAFRVESGHGFALRSGFNGGVTEPEESAQSSMPGIEDFETPDPGRHNHTGVILLAGAVVLIGVVILAMLRLTATPEPIVPCPSVSAVASKTDPKKLSPAQPTQSKPTLKPTTPCAPQPPREKPQPK